MIDYDTFRLVAKAVQNSPDDLFENYSLIKGLLLKRHPIAKNRPLLFNILESLENFKRRKTILIPMPYPLIKSCDTTAVYQKFNKDYEYELEKVDFSHPQTIIDLFRSIGFRGIRILAGMRHTTGSMYFIS